MLVRLVKKIPQSDFLRISSSMSKIEEISSILNQDFLSNSLKLGTTAINNKDKGMIFNRRSIGTFINTKYTISQVSAGVSCDKEYPYDSDRPRRFNSFVKMEWEKENTKDFGEINDIYFTLDGEQEGTEMFTMGNFIQRFSGDNQIFDLASFFYRRRSLYENTYRVLLANKNRLGKYTNSVFADNFVSLFSVKDKIEKVKNFIIPKENIDIAISADTNNPYHENISNRKNISYCVHPGNLSIYNVKLIFDEPDFLTIEFTMSECFRNEHFFDWTKKCIDETASHPIFNEFIDMHLNNWLKNLALLSTFQSKIYEKVKTKILINKI